MRPLSFGQLMDRALGEYEETGTIFGVNKLYRIRNSEFGVIPLPGEVARSDGVVYAECGMQNAECGVIPLPGGVARSDGVVFAECGAAEKRIELFGEKLELPFGPAAGPHTQLAQNIIAAYAAGGRFFELKTVQVLDGEDLPVSKPCILAEDEGYNVEWSTELYVPQALDEYIKAWFALKLLSRELGIGSGDGFIFNMSVGYDLEGIKTQKIDSFIDGLKNAENTKQWEICKTWAIENIPRFKHVDGEYIDSISPGVCRSVTLSTLHGCPPDEIERIASYLLTEKKLHTFIKCNPTLLGYDYARETLNKLGFEYIVFDDFHFKNDLQFSDAVPMLQRLNKLADSLSLSFGVKLTNTFPVKITSKELPGEEMYMSGRALFPLSIEVANRLSKAFDGNLPISFSGGADIYNIGKIVGAGIWPVTLATTLLKPGGYMRLRQIAEALECQLSAPEEPENAPFPADSVISVDSGLSSDPDRSGGAKSGRRVDLKELQNLVDSSLTDPLYRKPAGQPPKRKLDSKLPLLDCFTAPCRGGCPIEQDIPAYLRLTGEGKYLEALRVITERNPLPFITGTLCSHRCMDKCTRSYYESPVHIRSVKLEAATRAYEQLMSEAENKPKTGEKIAVIGGGPAGLSVAFFLARAGRSVTIFEKRDRLGGVVSFVIPGFRINDETIDKDIGLIKAAGIDVHLNYEIKSTDDLRAEGFAQIIDATGAWEPGRLDLQGDPAIDAVAFLEQLKRDPTSVQPGENVVIIGGGNTAMDAARAAKRAAGVNNVSIIYRRTKRFMPADAEELESALDEGVRFCELLSPISLKDGIMTCTQMVLGAPDSSGRRSPVSTDKTVQISADTVISATGNSRRAMEGADFTIGDAGHGPATIVEAIADAIRCAGTITGMNTEKYSSLNVNPDIKMAYGQTEQINNRNFAPSSPGPYSLLPIPLQSKTASAYAKKGVLYRDCASVHESERCLECVTVCECCVDVCPNRANVAVSVNGRQQIIHIDSMCNECGNCETFCPFDGAPYRDKFTLFACKEDFENSENQGFLPLPDGAVLVRLDGLATIHNDGAGLPEDVWELISRVSAMKPTIRQEN